jgi:hypothetical protein
MRVLSGILVVLMLSALDRAITDGQAMALISQALRHLSDVVFGSLMNLIR